MAHHVSLKDRRTLLVSNVWVGFADILWYLNSPVGHWALSVEIFTNQLHFIRRDLIDA